MLVSGSTLPPRHIAFPTTHHMVSLASHARASSFLSILYFWFLPIASARQMRHTPTRPLSVFCQAAGHYHPLQLETALALGARGAGPPLYPSRQRPPRSGQGRASLPTFLLRPRRVPGGTPHSRAPPDGPHASLPTCHVALSLWA